MCTADRYYSSLKFFIKTAIDRNDISLLRTYTSQATGAFFATEDDRFRELANYADRSRYYIQRQLSAYTNLH